MSQEVVNEEFVMTFGMPKQVMNFHERAAQRCQRELGIQPYPGRLGLHSTVKEPFRMDGPTRDRFVERMDGLLGLGRLPAVEVQIGAVDHFKEPEEAIYLSLYNNLREPTLVRLRALLEEMRIEPPPLDRETGYATLALREAQGLGLAAEEDVQLVFGIFKDLCPWKYCTLSVFLTELTLFERATAEVVKTWTLRPH
ncbi:MAG: hypothetical protein V4681_00215 [Patescibacteria group bacterium]